jgi:hypothetical protein
MVDMHNVDVHVMEIHVVMHGGHAKGDVHVVEHMHVVDVHVVDMHVVDIHVVDVRTTVQVTSKHICWVKVENRQAF